MKLPTKAQMIDTLNRPITQSLFLEIGYSKSAIYTLKEDDYEYEGKTYPSIKRLYMAMEDPTEYDFANTHFLGWKHWQRICANTVVRQHVDEWREELEYKMRSTAAKQMIEMAKLGNYQATKWMADKGWGIKGAGRPSKEQVAREKKVDGVLEDEYSADIVRLHKGIG
jgi:hypothetical protein